MSATGTSLDRYWMAPDLTPDATGMELVCKVCSADVNLVGRWTTTVELSDVVAQIVIHDALHARYGIDIPAGRRASGPRLPNDVGRRRQPRPRADDPRPLSPEEMAVEAQALEDHVFGTTSDT